MKHGNLAIFVPHIGCPNQCSFCDQKVISGETHVPTPAYVQALCKRALEEMGERAKHCEISFFGGSFTAIDPIYMVSLLDAACAFVGPSGFSGIRISTRPDAITSEILATLKKYRVTSIELGAQSMDDEVLRINYRGHTSNDVRKASALIVQHGFSLGLQMMIGLYKDTEEKAMLTAFEIAALAPKTVRIYPTIVIKNTLLADYLQQGIYTPLTLRKAVVLTSKIMQIFMNRGIKIIRVGLHPSLKLEEDMLGGPYHPAFRELCEGEMLFISVLDQLKTIESKKIVIEVSPRDISKMIGQKRSTILKLEALGYIVRVQPIEKMPALSPVVKEQ